MSRFGFSNAAAQVPDPAPEVPTAPPPAAPDAPPAPEEEEVVAEPVQADPDADAAS